MSYSHTDIWDPNKLDAIFCTPEVITTALQWHLVLIPLQLGRSVAMSVYKAIIYATSLWVPPLQTWSGSKLLVTTNPQEASIVIWFLFRGQIMCARVRVRDGGYTRIPRPTFKGNRLLSHNCVKTGTAHLDISRSPNAHTSAQKWQQKNTRTLTMTAAV